MGAMKNGCVDAHHYSYQMWACSKQGTHCRLWSTICNRKSVSRVS